MLDVILDLFGAALFLGQAVYFFLAFSGDRIGAGRAARSMIPAGGDIADPRGRRETGAHHF
ncbi:MAG TPA: hypothetical protein VHA35_21535 [Dongiaceae bacterium]|jgi:hypothetical protein|nr:hypothetical protein [Dongiaceae bacterium]